MTLSSQLLSFRPATAVALGLLLFVTACGGEETPSEPEDQFTPRVSEITVTPSSAELTAVGDTQQFEASAEDQRGNRMSDVSFQWTSSQSSVATVDSTGTAVGQESGSTTIAARASGVADSASLRVDQEVASLDVSPDSVGLRGTDDTAHLTAEVRDRNGNSVAGTDPEWTSTDTAVATVDSTGVVRAAAQGTANAIASTESAADTARVTVESSGTSTGVPASVDRTLPTRYYAGGVWDSRNQRILLHGGSDRSAYGGLWSYDPRTGDWTRLGDGPTRKGHQAVWDSAGGRLIFFGGNDGSAGHSIRNDIRIWDASSGTWKQANADGPTPRGVVQSSAVYAPDRKEMFVFGGMYRHKTDVTNQLFVYHVDENRWEELAPSGTQPEPRKGQSMVWDAAGGRLLMYGGWNSSDPRFDGLWEYDVEENRWTEISTGGEPYKRYRHGVAWDAERRHMYVFAGCCGPDGKYNDLWRYDAAYHSWSQLEPDGPRPAGRNRLNDQLFWDPVHDALIAYSGRGGCTHLNDLWAYVPRRNEWRKLSAGGSANPLERTDHAAVEMNGVVYSFGGCDGERQSGDLVRFDPETGDAEILEPDGRRPPGRSKHGLAAAPDRGEIYLYAGKGRDRSRLADLWAYDVSENRWRESPASGSGPMARFDPAWVWNPEAGEVLMFGGVNSSLGDSQSDRFLDDLWSYDPEDGSWEKLQARGTPSGPEARKNHIATWDSAGSRMLLYGGHAQEDGGAKVNFTDLWAYRPETGEWTEVDDGQEGPPHRVDTGVAWNPRDEQMLMYGGVTFYGGVDESLKGDLWRYDLPADEWSELPSSGPGTRQLHELVWLDGRARALLIGGYGGERGAYLGSVWRWDTDAGSWSQIR